MDKLTMSAETPCGGGVVAIIFSFQDRSSGVWNTSRIVPDCTEVQFLWFQVFSVSDLEFSRVRGLWTSATWRWRWRCAGAQSERGLCSARVSGAAPDLLVLVLAS
jgi:hypothetical protein